MTRILLTVVCPCKTCDIIKNSEGWIETNGLVELLFSAATSIKERISKDYDSFTKAYHFLTQNDVLVERDDCESIDAFHRKVEELRHLYAIIEK